MEENKVEETVVENTEDSDTTAEGSNDKTTETVIPEVLDENKEPVIEAPEALGVNVDEEVQTGDKFGQ